MKLCVITGATGGLGSALLQQALSSGAADRYLLFFRSTQKYQNLLDRCGRPSSVFGAFYEMESGSLPDFPAEVFSGVTEITVFLTAFTVQPIGTIAALPMAEIERNLRGNLLGQIALLKGLAAQAEPQKLPLRIVSIDSGASYEPLAGWSLYCSGKAFFNMYLRCFGAEQGCPVVLYEPGAIDTAMQETIRAADFPQADLFRTWKETGILHAPEAVAADLISRYLLRFAPSSLRESYPSSPPNSSEE